MSNEEYIHMNKQIFFFLQVQFHLFSCMSNKKLKLKSILVVIYWKNIYIYLIHFLLPQKLCVQIHFVCNEYTIMSATSFIISKRLKKIFWLIYLFLVFLFILENGLSSYYLLPKHKQRQLLLIQTLTQILNSKVFEKFCL